MSLSLQPRAKWSSSERFRPISNLMRSPVPISGRWTLVLVEGYKRSKIPKIEVHRHEVGEELFCQGNESLIAVASDTELSVEVRRFHLDDDQGIADFIEQKFLNSKSRASGKNVQGSRTSSAP